MRDGNHKGCPYEAAGLRRAQDERNGYTVGVEYRNEMPAQRPERDSYAALGMAELGSE